MPRLPLFLAAATSALMLSACGQDADAPQTAPQGVEAATAVDPGVAMPADAPPQEEAVDMSESAVADPSAQDAAGPCSTTLGQTAATALVQRCIAVSPATHPPCNVQNSCETIQGEIDRSCAMYGPDETRPKECAG